ncbi:hydrogenase nickel incorporation protein HypB [Acerihabitans sp. KWT182]|uniref:Hydrogenase maturation factor HypB n=1 Tax=Acerihabitans sp. KWT182 TaxID=3157919 RepID=A0AAU7QFF6_9GAMM
MYAGQDHAGHEHSHAGPDHGDHEHSHADPDHGDHEHSHAGPDHDGHGHSHVGPDHGGHEHSHAGQDHGGHEHSHAGPDHGDHEHSHAGPDHGDHEHSHAGPDHGDHEHSHAGQEPGDHQHAYHQPEPGTRHSAALALRRVALPAAAPTQIIHYHYYYGEVHNHYYPFAPGQTALPPAVGEEQSFPSTGGGLHAGPVSAAGQAGFAPRADVRSHLDDGRIDAASQAFGPSPRRMVDIEIDVLDKNNRLAEQNRRDFQSRNILALNLVSSPGSGKTSLLTQTLLRLQDNIPCAVIEGDQQTANDAERIRATGAPAIQVNTGKGCHLDAQMVQDAVLRLAPRENSLLFIENVGNLVCPAGFDLGERFKVVVLSVTEGEDKPLKYPHMFAAAGLMILNKIDLLPWVHFDVDVCIANARRVNPSIAVLRVSATGGEGMDAWLSWLQEQRHP